LRWWVTAAGGFFLSDGNDERSMHVQGFHGSSPDRCDPSHEDALPMEMLRPCIMSRMIQRHLVTAVGINGPLACGLAE
jgi:hypothetical protein